VTCEALILRRRRPDESSNLSRRCRNRLTLVGCHLPPRAVGISRSFNSRALALNETKPFARSARIVEARALARASAACLCASALLILPFVIRPRRVSVLPTVLRCQIPPRAVDIPLRFNSFASARWETKPAAISFRMVGSKARARESAARLLANAPCILRLPGEVSPLTCSIGPSWPHFDVRRGVKNVSRSGLRAEKPP
jgi:hypothetical protein